MTTALRLRDLWSNRLEMEVAYWDVWLGSEGRMWTPDPEKGHQEFVERFDPMTPLQANIRALIDAQPGAIVRILDVGAGPATVLGTQWPGRRVHITAIDPLGADYTKLLRRYGLMAPVYTHYGVGEGLEYSEPDVLFDFAYARNSLDHSYDPLRVIVGMVQLVKPGCCVYLLHHVREADTQQRTGLHQWNFYLEGDHYFLETDGQPRINLTEELAPVTTYTIRVIGNDVEVILRKR